jgi:restriction system protein
MPTWMIRGDGGRLYNDFYERSIAAIGWGEIAADAHPGMTRQEIGAIYTQRRPDLGQGTIISGASQVWRFLNEIQEGDNVITYSPGNRTYLYGTIQGEPRFNVETAEQGMALTRTVQWREREISRDVLTIHTRNSLGSTLSIFRVPDISAKELSELANNPSVQAPMGQEGQIEKTELQQEIITDETTLRDPLKEIEITSIERIKDLVARLDWDDLQELVAGILRAMGYKTQVSPRGADRGKDIVASPDGFGFEHPRIVVEVKHRQGPINSQAVRSFLGGRHSDDRGLFVSTGGFTKDAYYEADRAAVPLALWTMDSLVRTLVENYDQTDTETKRLVPLKRIYLPA